MKIEKSQIVGLATTLAIHALVIVLLVVLAIRTPQQEEESGIPVMLGNAELAQGHTEAYQFTEVSSVKSDVPNIDNAPQTQPTPQVDEPLVTQPDEPTIDMPTAEEIEAQKRAEAERQAAERAAQQMASAFGKGFEMGSKGEATESVTEGTQGAETGVSGAEKATGQGAQGAVNLDGRNYIGTLPLPSITAQEEGRVVVNITVNPEGKVIATSINLRSTNTANPEMRKAAEDAAKRTQFNKINKADNQLGTIIYYYKVR